MLETFLLLEGRKFSLWLAFGTNPTYHFFPNPPQNYCFQSSPHSFAAGLEGWIPGFWPSWARLFVSTFLTCKPRLCWAPYEVTWRSQMSMRSGVVVHAQRPSGRQEGEMSVDVGSVTSWKMAGRVSHSTEPFRLSAPSPPEPPLSVVMKYPSAVCFQHSLLLFQPLCVLPGRLYAFGVHTYFRFSVYLLSDW